LFLIQVFFDRIFGLMEDLAVSAKQVAEFMQLMTSKGQLALKYRITAGAGAADPNAFERRDIYVECKGPDVDLLLDHDGELLHSLEHIAAKILRLEPEDHDRISFDADGYKAERAEDLRDVAEEAIEQVKESGEPYRFAPMNSRERRMLHLFLKESGLQTSSSGEGPGRFVVLYPVGYRIPEERPRFDRNRGRGGPRREGRGR
jgi:spoIIIJ-associated protein